VSESSAAKPLFRAAALGHAGSRRYGTILLAHPVSHTVLTLMALAVASAIVLFLTVFSYSRKVTVAGVLLPARGVIRIVPPQSGIVVERHVQEGQGVQAGDVLFMLSSERSSATQGDADRTISALLAARRDSLVLEQSQLRAQSQLRLDAARRRIDDLGAEIRHVDDETAMQQRRLEIAQTTQQRFGELAASGYVSSVQAQDKQAAVLDQQQRLAELQRARSAAERDLAAAQSDLRELQVQVRRDAEVAQRGIGAAEQDLTENEARRTVVVRAPQAGSVTVITGDVGQAVGPGSVLAAVLPQGSELEAELYAPSRAVGFLKPGMGVQLRYQAYPYQKFGQARGIVRDVSKTAMNPDELSLARQVGPTEPLYRVRVVLERQTIRAYGQEFALRSGAVLDGSIVVDKRRLYEWVLEPLYTVSGRLFHEH
jgi:membrane fusion protein